jgi:phosphoribosylformimino-5-aminoimidazole carboxamide ribotide isomerase
MKLIPAIDLLNQKCVRLYQGNFDEVTYYDLDPIELAKHYQKLGCTNLHLVDLNGSKDGVNTNTEIIENLLNCIDLKIQMGGGIRNPELIRKWIKSDLTQLVIGSFAITKFDEFIECLDVDDRSRVIIALDISIDNNMPMVMIDGWQKQTDLDLWSMLNKFNNSGFFHFLITDISKDGTLLGPNLALYEQCMEHSVDSKIICSGGISSLNDLQKLRDLSMYAAVAGKSLLEQKITDKEIKKFLQEE